MSDHSGSNTVMSQREEAEKVTTNLQADWHRIAGYVIERCGDFTYDRERQDFIAEFLRASAKGLVRPELAAPRPASAALPALIQEIVDEAVGLPDDPLWIVPRELIERLAAALSRADQP